MHSTCLFDQNSLIVTGSICGGNKDAAERYLIGENRWVELPRLVRERDTHSSCAFVSGTSSALYIFGGYSPPDEDGTDRSTIERLDFAQNGKSNASAWVELHINSLRCEVPVHFGVNPVVL